MIEIHGDAYSGSDWLGKGLMIGTATARGLHEFVAKNVVARHALPGIRAVDLGAGPGAMCERLHSFGCEVVAVDRDPSIYQGKHRFVALDLNDAAFASQLGIASFDLVLAVEVIEHVESPIGFLRNVAQLLAPGGVAAITTPNVDSLPARVKFLLAGKLRTMDEVSDPTHISPIFSDLLRRQFLPRAGLQLKEHLFFPPNGYQLTRKPIAWTLRLAAAAFSGDTLGDHHILVLEAAK
jgi:2-polyprenyl-3-methyl-5-hydroxy-6-metoxy-1,4-benzoquinol methylase